tara:strand:+ start:594 stop:809 length:216 start_codon:yes stop_codon:yes gene_type:complete
LRVFDSTHAKGKYWRHAKRAGFISGLFIGTGLIGLVHTIMPFFLPEVMTLANKRISRELEIQLCACPEEGK